MHKLYNDNGYIKVVDANPYWCGYADDFAAGTRGNGVWMAASRSTAGDANVIWRFVDPVYIFAGRVEYEGALFGDWLTFELKAPATVVTDPTIPNTGNCILGGGVLIVPVTPGTGTKDVDYTARESMSATSPLSKITKAVPVPNQARTGYWAWDEETGDLSPVAGNGSWDLYSIPLTLVRYANRVPLLNAGTKDFGEPIWEPRFLLPHWTHEMTIHKAAGLITLNVAAELNMLREKST